MCINRPHKNLLETFPCFVFTFPLQMLCIVAMHFIWEDLSHTVNQSLLPIKYERNCRAMDAMDGLLNRAKEQCPIFPILDGGNCITQSEPTHVPIQHSGHKKMARVLTVLSVVSVKAQKRLEILQCMPCSPWAKTFPLEDFVIVMYGPVHNSITVH